jgi:hypothetical protein
MGSLKETIAVKPSVLADLDIADVEWHVLLSAPFNLMLVGKHEATDAVLRVMEPHLANPISRVGGETMPVLTLPSSGTLIMQEVAALGAAQQARLLRLLTGTDDRLRVISTTAEPIFSLVERNVFLSDLYYRLNVLRLDLGSAL